MSTLSKSFIGNMQALCQRGDIEPLEPHLFNIIEQILFFWKFRSNPLPPYIVVEFNTLMRKRGNSPNSTEIRFVF